MNVKILSTIFVCTAALASKTTFANPEVTSAKYNIPVNKQIVLKGSLLKTRILDCTVRSTGNKANLLWLTGMKNNTVVNGLIVPEGGVAYLVVNVGNRIRFEFEHRARLGVTNKGDSTVNLSCD